MLALINEAFSQQGVSRMNAKNHFMFAALVVTICMVVCSGSARAVPQFNVSFTSDTPGSAPTTAPATAGGVSDKPTFVVPTEELFGTLVAVQNTYTDSLTGNVFGSGNVVVLKDSSDFVASAALFQGAPADEISTGVFTVSLDWMQDSGPATSSGFIGLTNQNRGLNLSALFLDLEENSGNIRSGNDVNFGATLGTATRGVAHHLDWVVDLNQADFTIATELYLDGAFLAKQQREPLGARRGSIRVRQYGSFYCFAGDRYFGVRQHPDPSWQACDHHQSYRRLQQ